MLNMLTFSRNSGSALLAFKIELHGKTAPSLPKSSLNVRLLDNAVLGTPVTIPITDLHPTTQFKKRNIFKPRITREVTPIPSPTHHPEFRVFLSLVHVLITGLFTTYTYIP